jgi:hypothetical protein
VEARADFVVECVCLEKSHCGYHQVLIQWQNEVSYDVIFPLVFFFSGKMRYLLTHFATHVLFQWQYRVSWRYAVIATYHGFWVPQREHERSLRIGNKTLFKLVYQHVK